MNNEIFRSLFRHRWIPSWNDGSRASMRGSKEKEKKLNHDDLQEYL